MNYYQEIRKTCMEKVIEIAQAQPAIFTGLDATKAAKSLVEGAKILESYLTEPDPDEKLKKSLMR